MSQLYYGDNPLSQMPATYPASRVTHESVSVTADGVKKFRQILNEIYAQTDKSKLSASSSITIIFTNGYKMFFQIANVLDSADVYSSITFLCYLMKNNFTYQGVAMILHSTASQYLNNDAGTTSDASESVPDNGRQFVLRY